MSVKNPIPDETSGIWPTHYWHRLEDNRVQCDLCPRYCKLRDGQRGLCFVRVNHGGKVVLATYGRSSGYCDEAPPEKVVRAAREFGCRSLAFTYNDPVIFMEYAVDVAKACRPLGINTVAVTAGYICDEPRRDFFAHMDAVNVDLKSFNEQFYWKLTGAHLEPVLDTLVYLKNETDVWMELTTLLIPGHNDSDEELDRMAEWVVEHLGNDVPMHFSAFHPAFKMVDIPPTPRATLARALYGHA